MKINFKPQMKITALLFASLLISLNVISAPIISLASGTQLVESMRNDGVLLDRWVFDNDTLTIQSETNQTTQNQIVFPKMPGNPFMLIKRQRHVRYNGGMFAPVSGEDIYLFGIDSKTRLWNAITNEIPLVKLGLSISLSGHVGRRTIISGKYNKMVQLQKSLFVIDNRLDDRAWEIIFEYQAPVVGGGGVHVWPLFKFTVEPGERKYFSPTVTEASRLTNAKVEWMNLIRFGSQMVP